MSLNEYKPLSGEELGGPLQDFLDYCEAELERRRNSGEEFDEEVYREAIDLVVRRFDAQAEEKGI